MSAIMQQQAPASSAGFPVAAVRTHFPILAQEVHGFPLAYLDNAATAQKPAAVVDAVARYYRTDNANVHRGVHALSERATAAFEGARETVRRYIGAASTREVVFVRGTTEAINLVAQSLGSEWRAGDQVVITAMEHHANIVPWQLLRERAGIELRVVPIDEQGVLRLDELEPLLTERTRLIAVTHVSNALGTINPVEQIIRLAHARNVPVLVDGAQALPHMPVDVRRLGCDFYAFSAHKAFGPTGIGVLYGREELLDRMPPWQGGGDMIRSVTFERTLFNDLPYKFEAGTPNVAGAIGLGAALDYLARMDLAAAAEHEQQLLQYAERRLQSVPGVRIIGRAPHKAPVVSFVVDDIHPHDLGTILDRRGIAVRAGHHCAMPLMQFFDVPATVRASMAFYNTFEEIDGLHDALLDAREILA